MFRPTEPGYLARQATVDIDFVFPPVPYRNFDWSATRRGYEPGNRIGHGETESVAILDLLSQEAEQ